MAITTSPATGIVVTSAAKDGILGVQASAVAKQIILDTPIAVNNGNLESGASLVGRSVVIRRGTVDRQLNVIETVEADGVTCTCRHGWRGNDPDLGDTYAIGYKGADLATVAGCSFSNPRQAYEFSRLLQVGDNTNYALLSLNNNEHFVLNDGGPAEEGILIRSNAEFTIGTRAKRLNTSDGGILTFQHDGENEVAFRAQNNSIVRMFQFALKGKQMGTGVTVRANVNAGADLQWEDGLLFGVNGPFKKRKRFLRTVLGAGAVELGTIAELIANAASLSGWCTGDMDESILDAISGEPTTAKVYLVVEDT